MPEDERNALLHRMHIDQGMSVPDMARELGVDKITVSRWMDRGGIPRRREVTPCAKRLAIPKEERAAVLWKMHWVDDMTMQQIADHFGVHRRAVIDWFKRLGIRNRTIAEDNHRRYANMTPEQIKAQTAQANERFRELCKDEDWVGEQAIRCLTSQNFRSSKWECMVEAELASRGERFEKQKRFGRYIADFYLPDRKLVVEVDSHSHKTARGYGNPKWIPRDKYLRECGVEVLHLTNEEVKENVKAAVDRCDVVQHVDGS